MTTRRTRLGRTVVSVLTLLVLAALAPSLRAETIYSYQLLVNGRPVGTEQVTHKTDAQPPSLDTLLVRSGEKQETRLVLSTRLDPATRLPALHLFNDEANKITVEFAPGKLSLTRENLQTGQKTPATIEVDGPAVLVNFDSVAEYQVVIDAVLKAGGGPAEFQLLGLRRGDFTPGRVKVVKAGQTALDGVGALTEWTVFTPYRAARVWTDDKNVVYYASVPALNYELVRDGGKRLAGRPQPPSYVAMGQFMEVHNWLPGDLYDIPAVLSIPRNLGARAPGVVLLQGRGERDADGSVGYSAPNRDLAWGLASQGMVVLRFSKRSFAYRTSIEVSRMTLEQDIVEDARRAVFELARQLMVDRSRIYIVGWGLGGRVAPEVASSVAEQGIEIAGVVMLDSPAQAMDESMLAQTQYLEQAVGADPQKLKRSSTDIRNFMKQLRAGRAADNAVVMGVSVPYWKGLLENDPAKSLEAAEFPVLAVMPGRSFLTGEADLTLWNELIAKHKKTHPRSAVMPMPELGHFLMYGKGKELPFMFAMGDAPHAEAVAKIAEWIMQGAGAGE